MKLSVIVLTYNRSDALRPVLQSLARQCGPDDEVVVADDGSRREHVAAVCDGRWGFRCAARHAWHPDIGFTAATARNMGVLQSSGQYLVFLDGDCVPAADFLTQHRHLARQSCFLNGSRVLLSPRMSLEVTEQGLDLPGLSGPQWVSRRLRGDVNKLSHLWRWPAGWRTPQQAFRWKGIRSCNMGVWREDFMAIGGFDETFNGWGHEDADLVLRLHQHGVARVNGFMATEVFHLWHRENPRQNESENRNRVADRVRSGQVKADVGVEAPRAAGMKVTELT